MMLTRRLRLALASTWWVAAGCGGGSTNACSRVGNAFCANCSATPPKPGYCKGNAETSETAADACADELNGLTCDAFKMPTSSGACKTQLCAP